VGSTGFAEVLVPIVRGTASILNDIYPMIRDMQPSSLRPHDHLKFGPEETDEGTAKW
jgi:hypothetical protein